MLSEHGVRLIRLPFCALALAFILSHPGARSNVFRGFENQGIPDSRGSGDWLVVPGKRAGAVALGDNEADILERFPKPSIGSYRQPGPPGSVCGTEHTIGLLQDAKHPGFLDVFVKDSKVREIEADGARYHTAEGIASNSSPEEVRLHYKGLESYLFLGGYYEALNEGPLVLWMDEKQGMAFSFAYPSRGDKTLLVFTMIIFKPGAPFCVQGSVFPDADMWQKLPPYGLGGLPHSI